MIFTAGSAEVVYTCEAGVVSYCGGRVEVAGPGYLSSPGYPRYYLAGRECVWTLAAGRGQILSLQVIQLPAKTPDCVGSGDGPLLADDAGLRGQPAGGGGRREAAAAVRGDGQPGGEHRHLLQQPGNAVASSQNCSRTERHNNTLYELLI